MTKQLQQGIIAERFAWEKSAMIPTTVRRVARKVSALLKGQNIPHAIAGGMAVSLHGYDRMTRDIDIVVPKETKEFIESLGDAKPLYGKVEGLTVKVDKVDVDFIFLGQGLRSEDIASPDHLVGFPVIKIEPLIVMKMEAGRSQDSADIVALIKRGKVPIDETLKRLPDQDHDDFKGFIALADIEKKGDSKKARRMFLALMNKRSR